MGDEWVKAYGAGVTLYPVFKRLTMDLFHSVQIMQICHLEALRRKSELGEFGLLSGEKPSPVLREGRPEEGATGGVYLDDKYTIALQKELCAFWQHLMDEAADAHGMPGKASKFELASEEPRKILGNEAVGRLGHYRPEAKDVPLLQKAGRYLMSHRHVHVDVLEKLVGHVTWRSLLWRPLFGCMDRLYHFVRGNRGKVRRW